MSNLQGTRWRERDWRFRDRIIEITNDIDSEDRTSVRVQARTIENPHSPTAVGSMLSRTLSLGTLLKRWEQVSADPRPEES